MSSLHRFSGVLETGSKCRFKIIITISEIFVSLLKIGGCFSNDAGINDDRVAPETEKATVCYAL